MEWEMKKLLFGTTALVGAVAFTNAATAQSVNVGGALDIEITGYSEFQVEFADEDLGGGVGGPREWFFNQDTEVDFIATGVGDATGITYGANIELDIGDGSNVQFDETWLFFQSNWGEVRLGNDDAVTDNLRITSNFVERGTGGLDGDGRFFARDTRPVDGGEATKIAYYTPQVAGFQGGVSYAINGGDFGTTAGPNADTSDHLDVGVNYLGSFGAFDFGAYGGVSFFSTAEPDSENATGWQIGATAGAFGFDIAGSYWSNDDDLDGTGVTDIDNAFNIALASEFAGVGVSLAYQNESGFDDDGDADIYGGSADVGVLPGVALQGDVFYVDQDDTDGVNALVGLNVAF
ncbi:MAG: porin [Alphaproteobacteria bacterium]|jgi:hypothetical protein|nr:porin [Alphaproteobacteria bacterium]